MLIYENLHHYSTYVVVQIPPEFAALDTKAESEQTHQQSSQQPPPIYITFPQNVYQQQHSPSSPHPPSIPNHHHHHHHHSLPSRPAAPLTVQTQNLAPSQSSHHTTPSHSPMMTAAINTPLPPSPSPSAFLSDDEGFYGTHSPHTPNAMQRSLSNSSSSHLMPAENFMLPQQQQQSQQQLSPSMQPSHDPSYSNYHS